MTQIYKLIRPYQATKALLLLSTLSQASASSTRLSLAEDSPFKVIA